MAAAQIRKRGTDRPERVIYTSEEGKVGGEFRGEDAGSVDAVKCVVVREEVGGESGDAHGEDCVG